MGFAELVKHFNSTCINRLGGVTATVGTNDPFPVIFDAPYEGRNPHTNEIESYSPAATAESSYIAANSIKHHTVLTIAGTPDGEYDGNYAVVGIEPDAQGMKQLVLERQ